MEEEEAALETTTVIKRMGGPSDAVIYVTIGDSFYGTTLSNKSYLSYV